MESHHQQPEMKDAEATPTSFSHSYAQTKELTRKEKSLLVIVNNDILFLQISDTIVYR
jgi:cell division protein FtsL